MLDSSSGVPEPEMSEAGIADSDIFDSGTSDAEVAGAEIADPDLGISGICQNAVGGGSGSDNGSDRHSQNRHSQKVRRSEDQQSWDENAFVVRLDGFEGPLDMLLQLARNQKVDLTQISILQLVEQYLQIIESARKIRLELAADWLVMAAWLAWLKSCLLLPQKPDDFEDTEQAVDLLQERLEELEHINRAAEWMQGCSLLGHDVFIRGYVEDHTEIDSSGLILDSSRFVDAYIRIMRRKTRKKEWRIRSFHFWTVKDALARLKRLLGAYHVPGWHVLDAFLPDYENNRRQLTPEQRDRQWKAAWSGTLLAGLELAKIGEIRLSQQERFGQIRLQSQEPDQDEKERPEQEPAAVDIPELEMDVMTILEQGYQK